LLRGLPFDSVLITFITRALYVWFYLIQLHVSITDFAVTVPARVDFDCTALYTTVTATPDAHAPVITHPRVCAHAATLLPGSRLR